MPSSALKSSIDIHLRPRVAAVGRGTSPAGYASFPLLVGLPVASGRARYDTDDRGDGEGPG